MGTRYHGGKQRIGKEIALVMHEYTKNKNYIGYIEPFCGMLGVYQYVLQKFKNKKMKFYANDVHRGVVLMWRKARDNSDWIPPNYITEDEYLEWKKDKKDSADRTFIGFQYAYGGQWFGTYSIRCEKKKSNDQGTAGKRVMAIGKLLKKNNVKIHNRDYRQLRNLKGFIIYCDPPYDRSQCHFSKGKFNSDEFWNWAREMSKNNIVFVSNYSAPDDFKCIWTKTTTSLGAKRTEKLYIKEPQLSR